MAVTSDAFRRTLGRFTSGVTVVTAALGEQRAGLTVSAFSSLSLDPPLILVCIDKRSPSIALIEQSRVFNVNILDEGQANLSQHFASSIPDKFAAVSFRPGTLGAPLLDGTLGYLECRLKEVIDGGDHVILLGQVESADVTEDRQPLVYYQGRYRSLA
jgi:flavin reductase (DIM6/NTAB) family NADH-FMN oxidoreductase RutF